MFQVYQSSWCWLMFSTCRYSLQPITVQLYGKWYGKSERNQRRMRTFAFNVYRRRAIQILHDFRRQVRTKFVLFFLYKIKTNLLYVIQPSKPFLRYYSFMIHVSFHFSAHPRIQSCDFVLRMQRKTTNIPHLHTTGTT